MLGHSWEPAEGTCIDYRWKHDNEVWLMEVRPQSAPAFRVEVGHPGLGSDFKGPGPGQVCRMEVEVKKQKAKFDTSDPTLSHKAHRVAERARYAAELNATPGSAPAAGQNLVVGTMFNALIARAAQDGGAQVVVGGADAAPMINALLSGSPKERLAAIQQLKHQQQQALHQPLQVPDETAAPFGNPGPGIGSGSGIGSGTAAPFSGQSSAPFSGSGSAAPFSGSSAPFSGSPAAFSGSSAPFGEAEAPSGDPSERLARLQALHDQGLVSLAEYTAQRQRIIESL